MPSPIFIGTSGWMYKDWHDQLYPKTLKKDFLRFYSGEFDTVEVNTSFYHLPSASTFAKWHSETPTHFRFAVKLSRLITHQKRLKETNAELQRFFKNAKELGPKFGALLVQLPPSLPFRADVATTFFTSLRKAAKKEGLPRLRVALEPRHKSWFAPESLPTVRTLARTSKLALVFAHSTPFPSFEPTAENRTANFVYVRLHGPTTFASSKYGAARLRPWAKRLQEWHQQKLPVFFYFNNDVHGYAIRDARALMRLVEK